MIPVEVPRIGPSLQPRWGGTTESGGIFPQSRWSADGYISKGRRNVRYESGPVPFIMLREHHQSGPFGQGARDAGLDGAPLWVGETADLDPELEYAVKAPLNLYGFTDAWLSAASTQFARPLSLLLDAPRPADAPGIARFNFTFLSAAADANVTALHLPTRGVMLGVVLIYSSGSTGTPNTAINPAALMEGSTNVVPSAFAPSVGNITGDNQARVIAWGEVSGRLGATIYGQTASICQGEIDRFRLDIDGAGTGNVTLSISCYMRMREDR